MTHLPFRLAVALFTRLAVVLGALAVGAVAVLGVLSLRLAAPESTQVSFDELLGLTILTDVDRDLTDTSLDVPIAVSTGAEFTVVIDNIGAAAVELTVHGSYGLRRFTALAIDGQAHVTVTPVDHAESGVVLLVARAGDRIGWREVTLVAGSTVDPIESMLGARTIVANARDHTMVVSIPVDVRGNPVPRGTPVDWTLTRKGATDDGRPRPAEILQAQTDHLLAFKQITATTTAGTSKVAPIVDGAHGREASFIEVPGVPIAFGLQLLDPQTPADGRSLVRVRTDELVDQFGNVMIDGTRVSLDVRGTTGDGTQLTTSRLWGSTQQGRAQFVLQAPAGATTLQLTAWASGQASAPLTLEFRAAVTAIDVHLTATDGGLRVQIGPVLTAVDAYVSDGTTATVAAFSNEQVTTTTTVPLDDGVASVLFPHATDLVRVTILGHTVETVVPQ